MATFTTKEYIQHIQRNVEQLRREEVPLALAASTAHDIYINRIFNENVDANGSPISIQVSTKTPRRGAYSRTYAKTRLSRGRQIGTVDLVLEGLLRTNITTSLQKSGDVWVSGTTRAIETRKLENAIRLYGEKVFILSDEARKKAVEVAQFEYAKIMR